MAYVSQERKKQLTPGIKAVLAKYGMRATIGVRHHSTLVVRITQGPLDLIGDVNTVNATLSRDMGREYQPVKTYFDVNEYHIDRFHSGKCRDFLNELHDAMMVGNHDNSDPMTDYFDVGWYTDIRVGAWDKPYQYTGA